MAFRGTVNRILPFKLGNASRIRAEIYEQNRVDTLAIKGGRNAIAKMILSGMMESLGIPRSIRPVVSAF